MKPGRWKEALDCRVYARPAASIDRLDRLKERHSVLEGSTVMPGGPILTTARLCSPASRFRPSSCAPRWANERSTTPWIGARMRWAWLRVRDDLQKRYFDSRLRLQSRPDQAFPIVPALGPDGHSIQRALTSNRSASQTKLQPTSHDPLANTAFKESHLRNGAAFFPVPVDCVPAA
jgi:hypothetical protein